MYCKNLSTKKNYRTYCVKCTKVSLIKEGAKENLSIFHAQQFMQLSGLILSYFLSLIYNAMLLSLTVLVLTVFHILFYTFC